MKVAFTRGWFELKVAVRRLRTSFHCVQFALTLATLLRFPGARHSAALSSANDTDASM